MTPKKTSTKTSNPEPAHPTTSPSEGTAPKPASENAATKRPAIVFSLWTDRSTNVEVAVWPHKVPFDGKVQTRYTCTISRAYRKDTDGHAEWVKNSSFRTHDVPVLCFLLERAHAWMLAQRLDSGIPF